MCGACPHWRAWFCGVKGDCGLLKAREDAKAPERRSYAYGRSWTFKDDACRIAEAAPAA